MQQVAQQGARRDNRRPKSTPKKELKEIGTKYFNQTYSKKDIREEILVELNQFLNSNLYEYDSNFVNHRIEDKGLLSFAAVVLNRKNWKKALQDLRNFHR